MGKTLVYSITDGNSGATALKRLLEANLPEAEVHANRAGWLDLGVNCPDASHLTRFNTLGNLPEIRAFWKKKFAADHETGPDTYIDLTHLNAKAGLVENLDLLPADTKVVLVHLFHDLLATVWSLHNRCDYRNTGFTWLFGLDPNYRNVCVPSGQFAAHGMAGLAMWYVVEMRVRAVYYRCLTAEMPNVEVIPISLGEVVHRTGRAQALLNLIGGPDVAELEAPEPKPKPEHRPGGQGIQQGTAAEKLAKAPPAGDMFPPEAKQGIENMIKRIQFDPEVLGRGFFESGSRLGSQVLSKSASRAVH